MAHLISTLVYEPQILRFGTSGRRGRVVDLTQLEVYTNVRGELDYLQSLSRAEGGVAPGEDFFYAHDLRPSSPFLCQAVERALLDAGMRPVNMGPIPTPALTSYALSKGLGSIMVTGSHIPFDLNGYKLNTSVGELLKQHEAPIGECVARVREQLYNQDAADSLFDAHGRLKPYDDAARLAYIRRYTDFFSHTSLAGRRILAYQHSAVGRDLLVDVLRLLGADVVVAGRSDSFVAIDTEAIDDAQLATIQALVDAQTEPIWAVVSTDGDSDRPLILGVDAGKVRFFGGDLVGMIVASYLGADSVVVPISCNDAIDRGPLAAVLEPKTRIGSPHVIAGMAAARARGRKAVCGWEANGGFLLGSDIVKNGKTLPALATRDAILPILGVLFAAHERNVPLSTLFDELPPRFSRAALLRGFPRAAGLNIVAKLTDPSAVQQFFDEPISRLDLTDGCRVIFANGEVAHFRPSGNADEFRIYAVADTQARANQIVAAGIAEPNGTIRRMQAVFA